MTDSFAGPIRDEFTKLVQIYTGIDGNAKVTASKPRNHLLRLTLDLSESPLSPEAREQAIKAINEKIGGSNVWAETAIIGESSYSIQIPDRENSSYFLATAASLAAKEVGVANMKKMEADIHAHYSQIFEPAEVGRIMKGIQAQLHPHKLTPYEEALSGPMTDYINDHTRGYGR